LNVPRENSRATCFLPNSHQKLSKTGRFFVPASPGGRVHHRDKIAAAMQSGAVNDVFVVGVCMETVEFDLFRGPCSGWTGASNKSFCRRQARKAALN
jgi:hypothetical protein